MKRGFTLIELLVVVLIIGILSAVALPQYTKAVHKARFTENLTRLKTFEQTLDLYLLENGGFPSSEVDLTELYPDIVAGLEKGDDKYYYSKYGRYALYCDGGLSSPCRADAFYEIDGEMIAELFLERGVGEKRSPDCYYEEEIGKALCSPLESLGYNVSEGF